MKKRVVVALSGGVDSSVAAALLQEQGYEVVGITMCFSLAGSQRRKPSCCSLQGIDDARSIAHRLGIRHYVLNMQKALAEKVIDDFCREYSKGRTPNPCVRCNQYIKFGALLKKALSLGAQYLATGHYARIVKVSGPGPGARIYVLKKGKDKKKDQSYFLYRLDQFQLKHVLFPVGGYTKDEVRALAKKFSLPVADKQASQEICFLPQDDYRQFLASRLKLSVRPGLVKDIKGNILGRHKGVAFYTIGQREGLGIAAGYPIYITRLDHRRNLVIVGDKKEACKKEFIIKDIFWSHQPPKKKIALNLKIRYNHKERMAQLKPFGSKFKAAFRRAQFAITPGQSAVFYDKDKVLGGGIIDEVL
ncbi:MAG: tRNA 2-thiouridine(34) synthase MnmA [Candidatus Omnitrophica bacterium]|nr:tRNA 2-thiouridine(34) synthase MnmA [Candidatus Omnitrophota bacterium]